MLIAIFRHSFNKEYPKSKKRGNIEILSISEIGWGYCEWVEFELVRRQDGQNIKLNAYNTC